MRITKKWIANFIFNSNGIEGYYTPLKDIKDILKGKVQGKSPLILNQIDAIRYIQKHRKEEPTIAHICTLHSILLKDMDAWAGMIRRPLGMDDGQVMIGGVLAPDHKKVKYLLENWVQVWNKKPERSWTHSKAALYRHYEFEYIHPFYDGNGRLGRLLLIWDCLYHKVDVEFPTCEKTNRYEYYKCIQHYRKVERSQYSGKWE